MRTRIKRILTDEIITSAELAKKLGVKESAIRRRIMVGSVKGIKKGSVWLLDAKDDYKEARTWTERSPRKSSTNGNVQSPNPRVPQGQVGTGRNENVHSDA